MSQTQKISRNNTTVSKTDAKSGWSITLHSTVILQYWPDDRKIRVCTGGWYTPTTRTRLTQAFNEWQIPFWADFTRKTGNRITNRLTGEHVAFSRDHIAYANF